jgi:hypothetical protein
MNYASYITTFLFSALVISSAESQNQPVPPKIEQSFESLYPKAINALWQDQPVNNTTRQVFFDCNCTEGSGHLKITFDANGNVVDKDIVITVKDLPGDVTSYIESNYPDNGFMYGEITKIYVNTGTPNYRVELLQANPDGTVTQGGWVYILKFKASGEFISMDKRLQNN